MLDQIVTRLREHHRCHTVILYGSRARGDGTADSDYDLLGIRDDGEEIVRDTGLWQGVHLDLFIHPRTKAEQADETLLKINGGRVLCEKEGCGTALLAKVAAFHAAGSPSLPPDEIEARHNWYGKMLQRIARGDAEGNYRRVWMLTAALEDYFVLRGMWYAGPKAALAWLRRESSEAYAAFDAALGPAPTAVVLARVVAAVTEGSSTIDS